MSVLRYKRESFKGIHAGHVARRGFFARCFRPSLRNASMRSFPDQMFPTQTFSGVLSKPWTPVFWCNIYLNWKVQPPKIRLIHFLLKVPCGSNRFVESIRFHLCEVLWLYYAPPIELFPTSSPFASGVVCPPPWDIKQCNLNKFTSRTINKYTCL